MKKLIFMAAMLAVMVSCEKGIKDDSKPQQQAVTIRIGSATKADAITTINSLMPESLTLTLTSKTTNEQLPITTGETQTLPIDNYRVTCEYKQPGMTLRGSISAMSVPSLYVSQDLNIEFGKSSYEVVANISCFALVIDKKIIQSVQFIGMNDIVKDIPFVYDGDMGVVFIYGEFGSNNPLLLRVNPFADTPYKQTKYTLCTSRATGMKYVENGKYYSLGIDEMKEIEGGVIITLPSWNEGL
jgi:hypothetical protein